MGAIQQAMPHSLGASDNQIDLGKLYLQARRRFQINNFEVGGGRGGTEGKAGSWEL